MSATNRHYQGCAKKMPLLHQMERDTIICVNMRNSMKILI